MMQIENWVFNKLKTRVKSKFIQGCKRIRSERLKNAVGFDKEN